MPTTSNPASSSPSAVVVPQPRPHERAADAIHQQLSPKTVVVGGDAPGSLIGALRDLGIEADEIDAAGAAGAHRYDVAIHLGAPPGDDRTIAALARSEVVLLAPDGGATPDPKTAEPGAQVRADVVASLARQGLFRDFDHDASYLGPDAVLLRRADADAVSVAAGYERELHEVRARLSAQVAELEAVAHQLRKEVMRTRDLAYGRQAELTSALARAAHLESTLTRYDNVEQRLHEILSSRSWRLTQTIGLPVRVLRQRH